MKIYDYHLIGLLFVGAFLFAIGLAVVVTKRNAILILAGIELMLNAVNLNLVAFSQYDSNPVQGQIFALFVIVVAAAEVTVALAIVLKIYDFFKNVDLEAANKLKNWKKYLVNFLNMLTFAVPNREYGCVAQLNRAPDYGSGGLGFESLRDHQ